MEENWKCCQTCGAAAMKGPRYVFFHAQDAEAFTPKGHLRRGASLWLAFGQEKADGEAILKALRDQGLNAVWNGDVGTRIAVHADGEAAKPPPTLHERRLASGWYKRRKAAAATREHELAPAPT